MKILIVEDEPVTRMDLRYILEDAGFDVIGEGKDGFDAINLCKTLHPDLVIMDINMPGLDGISAAKVIRRDKLCNAVVFLTAYSDEGSIEGGKDAGVFGYLVKPLDEKNLIPSIKIAYAKALEAAENDTRLEEVSQKLEDRKIIERAKGYLMQMEGIDEETAYSRLRTLSMEKKCAMRVVCELILMTSETKGVNKK
jgi:response regulator NasT